MCVCAGEGASSSGTDLQQVVSTSHTCDWLDGGCVTLCRENNREMQKRVVILSAPIISY